MHLGRNHCAPHVSRSNPQIRPLCHIIESYSLKWSLQLHAVHSLRFRDVKVHYHKVIQEEHPYDCEEGVEDSDRRFVVFVSQALSSQDWKHLWHTKHQRYCCFLRKVACPVKAQTMTS